MIQTEETESTTDLVLSQEAEQQFEITRQTIEQMGEQFLVLKVNGVEDKVGFAIVHDARMIVKRTRVKVEKRRNELLEDARRHQRNVNQAAFAINQLLEPIELYLENEEQAVEKEKARLRDEKLRAEQERLRKETEAEAARLAEVQRVKDQEELAARKAELEATAAARAEEQRIEDERLVTERIALHERESELKELKRQQEEREEQIRKEREQLEQERQALEAQQKAEEDRKAAEIQAEAERVEAERIETERLATLPARHSDAEKILHVLKMATDFDHIELQTQTGRRVWQIYKERTEELCAKLHREVTITLLNDK